MRLTQLQSRFTCLSYVPCKHAFYRVWSDILGQGGTSLSLTSRKDGRGTRRGRAEAPRTTKGAGRRGADGPPTMSRSLNSLEGCCGAPMLRAPSQPETSNSPVCLRGKEKEKEKERRGWSRQAYYERGRKGVRTGCISASIR